MAIGRLRDIDRSDDAAWGDISRPKHMVHYDLEAFVWVTFYSILIYTKNLSKKEKAEEALGDSTGDADDPIKQEMLKRQQIRETFIKRLSLLFKHFTLDDVLQAKESFVLGGIQVLKFIEDVNLRKVAVGVWELLYDQNTLRGDPVLMTHDSLCKVFVDAGA